MRIMLHACASGISEGAASGLNSDKSDFS